MLCKEKNTCELLIYKVSLHYINLYGGSKRRCFQIGYQFVNIIGGTVDNLVKTNNITAQILDFCALASFESMVSK